MRYQVQVGGLTVQARRPGTAEDPVFEPLVLDIDVNEVYTPEEAIRKVKYALENLIEDEIKGKITRDEPPASY